MSQETEQNRARGSNNQMERVYGGSDGDSLKKIVSAMLRTSISSSTCGLSLGNISDAVEPPVFVHSRARFCQKQTPLFPSPPPATIDCRHSCRPKTPRLNEKKKEKEKEKEKEKMSSLMNMPNATMTRSTKLLSNGYGFTSDSSDGNDNGVLFSSDDDIRWKQVKEETETLFSSKSFSSDSSEFYSKTNNRKKKAKKKPQSSFRRRPPGRPENLVVGQSGTAVVKNSTDPYGDFRSSVLEMILENQILEKDELKQLLRSYLNLNSDSHHPVILQVFQDVWEALFVN